MSVTLDDAAGAAMVADHVLSLGGGVSAIVTGPERHASAVRRVEGAARVLCEHLSVPPSYGEWSERWGRQAVDLLARTAPDVDAIVAGSDQIARGVCDRLRETGVRPG